MIRSKSSKTKLKKVINDYEKKYAIIKYPGRSMAFVDDGVILFDSDDYDNPNDDSVFDLLHEIGHMETDKKGRLRCVDEYYATEWAIKHMKKYDVQVSRDRYTEYQDYILNYAKGRKNAPSKSKLKLSSIK